GVGEARVAWGRLVGQCPEGHRLGMVPGDSLERRAGEVAGQGGDPAGLVDQDVGAGGQVGDFVADDGVAGDDDGPVGGSDPVGDGAGDWPMVYLDGVYGDGAVGAVPDLPWARLNGEGGQVELGRRLVGGRDAHGYVVVEGGEHAADGPGGRAVGGDDRQRAGGPDLLGQPAGHRQVRDVVDVVAVHVGQEQGIQPCRVGAGLGQPQGGGPAGVDLHRHLPGPHQ